MKRYVKDKDARKTYQITWSIRLGTDTVATSTWIPAHPLWTTAAYYSVGDRVRLADGSILDATIAGTSGALAPVAPSVGSTVVDGGVTWVRSFEVVSDITTTGFTQVTVRGGTINREFAVTNHIISNNGQEEDETLVFVIVDK